MKFKLVVAFVVLTALNSCESTKITQDQSVSAVESTTISSITNKAPYDPRPGMEKLKEQYEVKKSDGTVKLKKPMHFLVFGDSKGSIHMHDVLKRADMLNPQFSITTADFVNKGAGGIGQELYKKLDEESGWFFRKYPTWPTLGNHEVSGPKDQPSEDNYVSGVHNFGDFFGLKDPLYSFTYGNAKFIAMDWIKATESKERMDWLENELKDAKGKLIFVFKHRPYYTVGNKSYSDVEGKSTPVTELFSKYNVTAVFSGHDHLYYRTIRDGVNYIVSAGAGANIYQLKRAGDAIPGDAYYGRTVENDEEFLFHSSKGEEVRFNEAMYFVVSVKVKGEKVTFEMIDTEGKSWDTFTFDASR
ncbi:metallophosphoesterase family protein [Kriegella aquimaris]|uniref:Calcineurin-like phosphoesterase n=1 Tax=Kriegella aquimaris TaxID=192904 RepID=A0A1G9N421_9FLAO|nr:metallophosphoesterase [Kriegella aquimaris]SDL81134.1 Calcineurin-like phosphoesterase [Kriegella aquimaris]